MNTLIHKFQTFTRMPARFQKGQVLIIVTLAIVGIVAIIGLALDVGITFVEYARLRRAVDAADTLVRFKLDAARAGQLCGRPRGDELAAEQDRDAVADELDLREQVRVEQDGDATAAQFLEEQAYGAAADRVERRGRLVEEQDARLADERLRDAEPLLHPLRHAVHAAARGVRERDELEQPAPLGGAAVRAGEALVQLEHLVGRVPAGEAEELGEVAERSPCRPRSGAGTGDLRLAGARAHEPDRDLHECRLPGAVRAEQADELPLGHLEIDAFQRLDGAVALRKPADGECNRHRASVAGVP